MEIRMQKLNYSPLLIAALVCANAGNAFAADDTSWAQFGDAWNDTSSITTTPPTTATLSSTIASTAAVTTSAYTTINDVITDMSTPSEAVAINPQYNWQRQPITTTYAPRGDAIASWWTGNRPTWTYTALSWFTAFEAQGNLANNSRVEVRNLRMYMLSESTRQWSRVDISTGPRMGLWAYPFNSAGSNTGERTESDGGKSIKPKYPNFHHGYGNAYLIKNPSDVRATFVAMDFRLVVDDASKSDDRGLAKYVVDVGGDYYPGNPNTADTSMTWSLGYAPGMGNGRYLQASNDWRTASMIVPNTGAGATMDELRNNPPPLAD
jgi:hypothetical protein